MLLNALEQSAACQKNWHYLPASHDRWQDVSCSCPRPRDQGTDNCVNGLQLAGRDRTIRAGRKPLACARFVRFRSCLHGVDVHVTLMLDSLTICTAFPHVTKFFRCFCVYSMSEMHDMMHVRPTPAVIRHFVGQKRQLSE